MSAKIKKFRSKFFRIGVEGATSDGRVIERGHIEEMANSYNPKTYGARVWIEHMRSLLPESPFRAYGDVTALKAEEVEIDGKKKLALFAQIEPTKDLVHMVNVLKQKLYTSMEIAAKFADTGKAYLQGLAVTDSPASLGTDMLSFAAQNPAANPLASRKQNPDNLFTAAVDAALEFEEFEEDDTSSVSAVTALLSRIADLLKGKTEPAQDPKPATPPAGTAEFTSVVKVLEDLAKVQSEQFAALNGQLAARAQESQQLRTDFAALKQQLSTTPAPNQTTRPAAIGGNGIALTDC